MRKLLAIAAVGCMFAIGCGETSSSGSTKGKMAPPGDMDGGPGGMRRAPKGAPKTDAPKTDAPKTDAPKTDAKSDPKYDPK